MSFRRTEVALAVLLAAACHPARPASPVEGRVAAPASRLDARIAEHRDHLARNPSLWAVRAQLAGVYLEKARETGETRWLALAEEELDRSLAIQPNLPAWIGHAALACHRHRFEDALRWTELALGTAPERSDVRALAVEAYRELGRHAEAEALLPGGEPRDFLEAATLANWRAAKGDPDGAARALELAARLAGGRERETWARVRAAGVYLDAGRPAEARRYLDAAERLTPADPQLAVHRAEWHEAEGRPAEALALLRPVLARGSWPDLHERAARLAERLGDRAEAEHHRRAAARLRSGGQG
jgi:tetratricopeptide (TPR) repeat protein